MPNGKVPLAFCPTHGLFPAHGTIRFPPRGGITIINSATGCPWCGKRAEIIPGLYENDGDTLNILIDPSISPAALKIIQTLAQKVEAGEIGLDEAKAEAEKVAPKAGRLFDIRNWSDQAQATVLAAGIAAATALILRYAPAPSASPQVTNIYNQPVIERVIERTKDRFRYSGIIHQPPPIPRPRPEGLLKKHQAEHQRSGRSRKPQKRH